MRTFLNCLMFRLLIGRNHSHLVTSLGKIFFLLIFVPKKL